MGSYFSYIGSGMSSAADSAIKEGFVIGLTFGGDFDFFGDIDFFKEISEVSESNVFNLIGV